MDNQEASSGIVDNMPANDRSKRHSFTSQVSCFGRRESRRPSRVREMRLAMTTKLNIADSASASRRAANRESGELLLHSEERGIDECSEAQRKERSMDKTLADSFPASDPPSWHSRVRLSEPSSLQKGTIWRHQSLRASS